MKLFNIVNIIIYIYNYMKKKVLIVGLGWGSTGFLKSIDNDKYSIEVYSIDDFLYTPLLAQNIKYNKNLQLNAREINKHVNYLKEEITHVNFDKNTVQTINEKIVDYDYLILCNGSNVNTFNIKGVNENCHFVKNNTHVNIIKDALLKLPHNSNIAVIGCGLTGSEIIGTLIDYNKFNIHAIDAFDRPLISFHEKLSNYTLNFWKDFNVNMYLNHKVSNINKKYIEFDNSNKINYDLAILFNNDFKCKKPFIFNNKGQIGYIGRNKSVCDLPYLQSGGNLVYYLNRLIHVYNGVTYTQKWNFF